MSCCAATPKAALARERLALVDVPGLKPGGQRNGLFTDHTVGVLDDLMVANRGDHLFLAVTAACKAQDFAPLRKQLSGDCGIAELTGRSRIALQGPAVAKTLAGLIPEVAVIAFMDVREVTLGGAACLVWRSDCANEAGYEISAPAENAVAVTGALLADPDERPTDPGARDSFQPEAGRRPCGAGIDAGNPPVAAALARAAPKRRIGGARADGFPGAAALLPEFRRRRAPPCGSGL